MDSLAETIAAILRFRDERDWGQFHSPNNLAVALAIEAGELLENFLWIRDGDEAQRRVAERAASVREEVADVLIYALSFCAAAGIDPLDAIHEKLQLNAARYPVDASRGRATKHSDLPD